MLLFDVALLLALLPERWTGIGRPVGPFTLRDCHGKTWATPQPAERPLLVVAFLGPDCPLGRLYARPLRELAEEFGPRGVGFVGVASTDHRQHFGVADRSTLLTRRCAPASDTAYLRERQRIPPIPRMPAAPILLPGSMASIAG